MHIEPVNEQTLPDALDLLKLNGLPINDIGPQTQLFVLSENDHIAATVGIENFGDTALLRSVSVSPGIQKKGLGKELVKQIELKAREKGIKEIYLLTETARDFFSKLDYQLANREQVPESIRTSGQFSSTCPASATLMHKALI